MHLPQDLPLIGPVISTWIHFCGLLGHNSGAAGGAFFTAWIAKELLELFELFF